MEQQQQAWGLRLLGLSMIQFNSISVSLSLEVHKTQSSSGIKAAP